MEIKTNGKPIAYSGIKPTGLFTLGNYCGAIRHWIDMQEAYDCLYCVADLHALTVREEPTAVRQQGLEAIAMFLAVGLDPKRSVLYFQSHVSAHSELTWILNCYTYMGEMSRMTQFKEKSAKTPDNVNAGLYDYPVLMAADILLYQTDVVPVGEDQKQHVELTRNIAERFNGVYGPIFRIPEPRTLALGGRVRSLQDPAKKMSKSDEAPSYIALTDPPATIRKKFRRAVTDLGSEIVAREDKPGVSNLLGILSIFSGTPVAELEAQMEGKGYGTLKDATADAVIAVIEPIQQKQQQYLSDLDYLRQVAKDGAQEAARRAETTLKKVYDAIGLVPGCRF